MEALHIHNKKSCVDYTMSTTIFMKQFQYFSISPPDMELSDHCIQKFDVKCEVNGKTGIKVKESKSKNIYDTFKWSDNGNKWYDLVLLDSRMQDKMCTFLTNNFKNYDDSYKVDRAVSDVTEIMVSAGKATLKIINRNNGESQRKNRSNCKVGFDQECFNLREEVRSLGRALQRNPFSIGVQSEFMFQSKKYKSFIRKKERDVNRNMVDKLCRLKSSNPKEFWKLLNKINTRSETDNVNYIDLDQWKSHFEGIYTSSDVTDNVSLYKDEEITNLEQDSEENVLLSSHFTIGEIKKHIKLLKNNNLQAQI